LTFYIVLLFLVSVGLAVLGVFGVLYSSTVRLNIFVGTVPT
jgi:hypothetical protein